MEAEIVEKSNQLEVIVKESGLEETKANVILKKFQDYFKITAEWELRAKTIIVTDESQTDLMALAKTGRKLLSERRIEVENTRKALKEQSLREGKAIDGIANVLKGLIAPIEEHLKKQENFIELKREAEKEVIRLEIEKRMQEEEQKKIEAEKQEQIRIKNENDKLKQEAIEREAKIQEERKKQEEALKIERAKAEAEKKAIEDKARLEREKAETERKKAEMLAAKEREAERAKAEAERKEKERLAEILKNTIECPNCKHKFTINK
jgi:hypothetical protein